ncbi:MAG TPA: hydantoinase/oxoprolinase family protein [Solirubrobacteraceae bacterium]|nr:hydantoinase/oxoprolinase family protein [Solirubrobacteraceae bacterium]
MTPLRMAADVGGSFTDLVVDDGTDLLAFKAPTTPADPAAGVLDAVAVAAHAGAATVAELLGRTEVFVHGTTRALNAVLTGQTARTALLTTAGHPDVLLFREGGRTAPFDLEVEYPRPLVPRALTFEVPERIVSDGGIRRPLDEDAVVELIGRLREENVEAVAVCLLWSVVDGRHERRVGELLDEHLPGVPYTLSHVLNPTLREYRRACSTALNASLLRLMGDYLEHLGNRLRDAGLGGRLMLVSSSGGTLHAAQAARAPIHALNSGPAMAPAAARSIAAAEAAAPTAVVFDSGGTTCDVSVIRDGAILATRETWVGPLGAGHITGFPSVDVRSIAAGGGSIASVDREGLLHVGPRSAGADPGPACYGRGGTEPTMTDACLVAGYLDPDTFLDGALRLDAAAAEAALAPLAAALGVTVAGAADAVIELATDHLVAAIEQITLGKGVDPRTTPLVGGGGAAGLNIVAIARRLGAPLAIVPAYGATLSAAGALVTPLVEEHAVTAPTASDRFDADAVRATAAELGRRCAAFHASNAAVSADAWVEYSVEARYRHQVWDLVVDHPPLGDAGSDQLADLVERVHAAHERAYGVDDRGGAVEFLTWRARA